MAPNFGPVTDVNTGRGDPSGFRPVRAPERHVPRRATGLPLASRRWASCFAPPLASSCPPVRRVTHPPGRDARGGGSIALPVHGGSATGNARRRLVVPPRPLPSLCLRLRPAAPRCGLRPQRGPAPLVSRTRRADTRARPGPSRAPCDPPHRRRARDWPPPPRLSVAPRARPNQRRSHPLAPGAATSRHPDGRGPGGGTRDRSRDRRRPGPRRSGLFRRPGPVPPDPVAPSTRWGPGRRPTPSPP